MIVASSCFTIASGMSEEVRTPSAIGLILLIKGRVPRHGGNESAG